MQQPLISITIPAYKSKYLGEAIESCLFQTYTNYELIIVDDASPEDLLSIVKEYDDTRIRYYRNKKNCGAIDVVDNWNICLGYCKGEYVICMGDDDRLKPYCLDEYVRLINSYPNLNVYHAWTELINGTGEPFKVLQQRPEYQGCMEMIWDHWNGDAQYIGDFCFKVEHLRQNGGYFKQPLAWASDDISTARAAAGYGIANTPKVAFQYRENPLTISKGGNSNIKIEAKLLEKKWFHKFLYQADTKGDEKEELFLEKLKEEYRSHYRSQVLQYIKEYMHESLLNIIPIVMRSHYYGIDLMSIFELYIKVVKYEIKNRKVKYT